MTTDPQLITEEFSRQVVNTKVKPNPPEDFEAFWIETREALKQIPMDLEIRHLDPTIKSPVPTFPGSEQLVFAEWYANSLDGRRIGGPVIIPKEVRGPQWVYSHGYGSIGDGSQYRPDIADLGFIALGLDARGFNRSRKTEDPSVPGWVIHHVEDKDKYILRGAVADFLRAVQVARSLDGSDPLQTVLAGASFAGGLAALTAPWIDNLKYVVLEVPTFGGYSLRREMGLRFGSGGEINIHLDSLSRDDARKVMDNLRYFDAVNAAALVRDIPVSVGLGIIDEVVPGPSVAAIYHALATEDKELLTYPCSHSDHPLTARWSQFAEHVKNRAAMIVGL